MGDKPEQSEIENKIEQTFQETKAHLEILSKKKDVRFHEYIFPEMSITNLRIEEGQDVADIEISVNTYPAFYDYEYKDSLGKTVDTKYLPIKSIQRYFRIQKQQLERSELTNAEKACHAQVLEENILDNYTEEEHKGVVQDLTSIFDELIEILVEEDSRVGKPNYFPVQLQEVKELDPKLKNAKSIHIVNLLPELFFKTENYVKILKHKNDGKFGADEPCKIKLEGMKILYE